MLNIFCLNRMRTKFWSVFANWSFVTLEDYFSFCRPLIAAVTRNSRDNMYQEVYQAYNVSKMYSMCYTKYISSPTEELVNDRYLYIINIC